ncbi:hypothetical protein [Kitasatospora cystarginea]|uniref:hypothetical protein n=1 Tax=Kitasatospora cystarginea TaxID=58350 RepID=UPI0031DF4538
MSTWKNAKGYGQDSRPVKRDYAPGSWITWDQDGRTRAGIVTDYSVSSSHRYTVVPSDGGDMLPFNPPRKHDPNPYVVHGGRALPATPAHDHLETAA